MYILLFFYGLRCIVKPLARRTAFSDGAGGETFGIVHTADHNQCSASETGVGVWTRWCRVDRGWSRRIPIWFIVTAILLLTQLAANLVDHTRTLSSLLALVQLVRSGHYGSRRKYASLRIPQFRNGFAIHVATQSNHLSLERSRRLQKKNPRQTNPFAVLMSLFLRITLMVTLLEASVTMWMSCPCADNLKAAGPTL